MKSAVVVNENEKCDTSAVVNQELLMSMSEPRKRKSRLTDIEDETKMKEDEEKGEADGRGVKRCNTLATATQNERREQVDAVEKDVPVVNEKMTCTSVLSEADRLSRYPKDWRQLEMELGDGVYEELSGESKERLADMRHIAEWERQPVAIYNTLLENCDILGNETQAAERRQWQTFLRLYLRRLAPPELLEFVRATNTTLVVASHSTLALTSLSERVGALVRLGEVTPAVRRRMLAHQPRISLPLHTIRRPIQLPSLTALESYFHDEPGCQFMARLVARGVDTLGALRAMSASESTPGTRESNRKVTKLDRLLRETILSIAIDGTISSVAIDETISSIAIDDDTLLLDELEKLPVDGPYDRMLKTLHELGVELPKPYLLRYHAVYEWAIARQDAHDTEVAAWQPWLQVGRRISLVLWYRQHVGVEHQLSVARAPASAQLYEAWRNHSTSERDEYFGHKRYVHVHGTVINTSSSLSPSQHSSSPSSSISSSSLESPSSDSSKSSAKTVGGGYECTVMLDDNQVPWLSLPVAPYKLDQTLTFIPTVKFSEDRDVGTYMRIRAKSDTSSRGFDHVTWSLSARGSARTTYLESLFSIYAAGDFCIEPPKQMTAALTRALTVRGQHVAVQCLRIGPAHTVTVEGRVLRGGTTKEGVCFLQLWVDGHIVTFKPLRVSVDNCELCHIETLWASVSNRPAPRPGLPFATRLRSSLRCARKSNNSKRPYSLFSKSPL